MAVGRAQVMVAALGSNPREARRLFVWVVILSVAGGGGLVPPTQ